MPLDTLTKNLMSIGERLGTDYQCLTDEEKLVLSYIYLRGTYKGICNKGHVPVKTLLDLLWSANYATYFNSETAIRHVKKIIQNLRFRGWPILTSYINGYIWPESYEEIRSYRSRATQSIVRRFAMINKVTKSGMRLFDKQPKLEKIGEDHA